MTKINKKNPIAIIQARMGSTRLPGKIFKLLSGKPVLWHCANRLKQSKNLNDIVIATTKKNEDDPVVEFCKNNKINLYRGNENDVLDRYYQCAKSFKSDPIVRISADSPVIDPTIVDEVLEQFLKSPYDIYRTSDEFPGGLDCECFSFDVLEDTWKNANLPSEREHVCPYIYKHPEKYKIGYLNKFTNLSHYRWNLDEKSDFDFLNIVFNRLYKPGKIFLTQDIFDLLKAEPQLLKINSGIIRNEGYLRSLKEDKEYLRNRVQG